MMQSKNNGVQGGWWKLGGVILFLYVLIGGLVVPLNPGITMVQPTTAKNGDTVTIAITGYNTHLQTGGPVSAWLKLDSAHLLKALDVRVSDEITATATFSIPGRFPDTSGVIPLTLILSNETDGSFVQPNALFITLNPTGLPQGGWKTAFDPPLWSNDTFRFPYRNILNETIRNTFFHIALWFAMFVLLIVGLIYAVRYLRKGLPDDDILSAAYHKTAILFGILGIVTGSVWAKYTWNTFWTTDVKLNMTAVAMLIYLAYLVLRNAIPDPDKRARMAAGYSIFAFVALIPLVFVIPRLTDSLHPGNGGNPALGGEDLDHTLRLFFYPSILALILIGNWMTTLLVRYERLKQKIWFDS